MSRIRGTDTKPEVRLRKLLWKSGYRYRKNHRIQVAGVRPDLVFLGSKVAVFVDGCFWHGCPVHYQAPKNNAARWSAKLLENQTRDRRNTVELEKNGWRVLRFWEHEIDENVDGVADVIAAELKSR